MNSYLSDILDQPAALQETLDHLLAPPVLISLADDLRDHKFRRVVLTGMGSSYHSLIPLYLRLMNAGLPAVLIDSAELIHHSPALLQADSLIVAVSQSGRSAEIVRLLEEKTTSTSVIGVTNTPVSPLAGHSNAVILTHAGEEFSVSCKTYLATLAALVHLGDCLLEGQSPPQLPGLAPAPRAVASYLAALEDHVQHMVPMLSDIQQVFLAGRGASLAAAGTGGLILKEAVHIPAEGLSSAAFRHGPFEMNGPHTAVVVFDGCKPTADLNRKLVRDIHQVGGWAALVEMTQLPGPFLLPPVPEPALPILEILPIQMMTLALAKLRGMVAGQFHLGSKVTSSE